MLALVAESPDVVAVVAPAATTGVFGESLVGSFRGFGVDLEVTIDAGDRDAAPHPVSWTTALAVYELARAGWSGPVVAVEVGPEGRDVDESSISLVTVMGDGRRWGVVAVGDGSAALSVKAPGYLLPGADEVDRDLTQALVHADLDRLRETDLSRAKWAHVGGAGVWATCARAVASLGVAGTDLEVTVNYDDAPLGVHYLVGRWQPVR